MKKFEIKEEFYLNGEPLKIWSGAIHYFRIHPDDWYHSLYNLKALGFNTVETYVPWNMHEKKKGEFDFSGILDLEKFIRLAESLDLLVIVRPSPYICAEWEFGGLPYWLLNDKEMRIRSRDESYLKHVGDYYHELFKILTPLQITQNGPIIMMQIENEYGSFGGDKEYLRKIKHLMLENGVEVPLFTSDGAWEATLQAGSMIEDDILPTGNFGSKGEENFSNLKAFHESHGKNWPLMCMEFWDGWFNRYHEPIVTREVDELVASMKEVMLLGSINLYMFHGGTNFGFMNGCSARGPKDLPQITSYDYGAPLDEQGNPTEKYYAMQQMIKETFPETKQLSPKIKATMKHAGMNLKEKVSLFNTLESIPKKQTNAYPLTMEKLEQHSGYVLYRTTYRKDTDQEKFRIIDGRDRAQFFLNEQLISTQYQEEIGEDIEVLITEEMNTVDVLIENMGRVNYGHKLLTETQRKGLRQGVMSDLHFMLDWEHYSLDFETSDFIDFSGEWQANQPAFYRYNCELTTIEDTFLDVSKFGKGIVLVNGVNIGRFWETSPMQSLYIPKHYLKQGHNDLIIFETEGKYAEEIQLVERPIYKEMKENV
ncbi:glycoside hydrolase family 35 protein [Vagococcus zengguangii]|uniref:Beta-galactosidase n=1 Tax=Vagococcus zengguangii TaxID=2571750 RepID=A0A4D7CTR6_9ENTE|nr:beta-galactosidase family protein [Vagococcus zengguangii]QCI85716.1 beta-galactosidase [Vagococcus zengguangii]TLG81657.1 beta-galactosidase [Vagococcus zengguangii]